MERTPVSSKLGEIQIKLVHVEFLRAGPPHNQLLSPLTEYLAISGDSGAGVVSVPYEHSAFERRLRGREEKGRERKKRDRSDKRESEKDEKDIRKRELRRSSGQVALRETTPWCPLVPRRTRD